MSFDYYLFSQLVLVSWMHNAAPSGLPEPACYGNPGGASPRTLPVRRYSTDTSPGIWAPRMSAIVPVQILIPAAGNENLDKAIRCLRTTAGTAVRRNWELATGLS